VTGVERAMRRFAIKVSASTGMVLAAERLPSNPFVGVYKQGLAGHALSSASSVVPFDSLCEYAETKPRKMPTGIALDESRPLKFLSDCKPVGN
jgi:hypothetical protein